ncbi:MAG: hypothetical protein LBC63_03545 [Holophagales bacterium]|jgi:UDP-3-O-[3-hydroxymyristoyl] glucosamine N-acyltransferase|nr:hypothetical protein [Holophagales bacterium]
MSLSAIIIANRALGCHPVSDGPRGRPLCLKKILGDTLLQWQLRALPKETERVCILACNGYEEIANLAAKLVDGGDTHFSIDCIRYEHIFPCGDNKQVLQLLPHNDHILLIGQEQPLVNQPDLLQRLATETCALTLCEDEDEADPIAGAPISLPMSALKFAIDSFPKDMSPSESELDNIADLAELGCVSHSETGKIAIQTMADFSEIQAIMRKRIVSHLQEMGICFIDPATAFVGPRVELSGSGVTIEPMARLEGKTIVGDGATIGQGSIIIDSVIGPNVEIRPYSVISNSIISQGAKIGPFAHLREGSEIGPQAHVGNFVETKKTRIGSGSKANHLSYLGDCQVGEDTNVGAGCITCNYDGFAKHKTLIGSRVFIGSGSQLVAPVEVGDGAILGAGTTLTANAPSDALILTRPETIVKAGGAQRLREKKKTNMAK